jgi:hypothetical protein
MSLMRRDRHALPVRMTSPGISRRTLIAIIGAAAFSGSTARKAAFAVTPIQGNQAVSEYQLRIYKIRYGRMAETVRV